jgi:hypothetical protein
MSWRDAQLKTCAQAADQGYHLAYVVCHSQDVSATRGLCAGLVQPSAVMRGRLHYCAGFIRFVQASGASFVLTKFYGLVVLDAGLEVAGFSEGFKRELRNLRDACAAMFPDDVFSSLRGEL